MILVTGATGTSGVEIVRALLKLGERPRVLARNPGKAAELLGDDVEIARGDFGDDNSVEAALEAIDAAMLLSAPTPDTVEVQQRFVDAAKRAGVGRIVKFSAVGAAPGARARFCDWHGRVEHYIEASGLAWTHLRPSFFMQNLLGFAGMIKGGTIYQPTGQGRAPFVDARDIGAVAAHVLAEEGRHDGRAYEVTGPKALGYADVAATFSRVLGRPVAYVDVPVAAAKQSMTQAGMPEWQADAINELSEEMKQGHFATVTDVVERVGKKKPRTLEQFVRENKSAFA
jgi:uncharacterized protein YbjT (DUF2867 family)